MIVNFVFFAWAEVAIVTHGCFFAGRNARDFVMAVWIVQILFMRNFNCFFSFGNSVFRLFLFAGGFLFGFTLCNRFFDCRFMRFFCALNRLRFGCCGFGYFFCFSLFVDFLPFSQDFFHRFIDWFGCRCFRYRCLIGSGRFICYFRRNGVFTGNATCRSNAGPCDMHFCHKAVWRWWSAVQSSCLSYMNCLPRYSIFTA